MIDYNVTVLNSEIERLRRYAVLANQALEEARAVMAEAVPAITKRVAYDDEPVCKALDGMRYRIGQLLNSSKNAIPTISSRLVVGGEAEKGEAVRTVEPANSAASGSRETPAEVPGLGPAASHDEVNEIDTQKPAPRECHNGTACTSWDCTYPNCTFPPKKPEAPLQRDTQTAKSVGALMVTVPDRLPPTAVPRVVAAWHQVANWSVIDLVEHIYAVGVAAAKEAEETHRT
jgi:hypothetical protein